ncbi:MAG: LCP family protein [Lawsonibacter sp.]|nr:LCP family protein [Lawsonibacter sp.]
MSENHRQHGKREADGGAASWWGRFQAWRAGLNRSQRIRFRICAVLAVVAILAVILVLFLRSWIRLPTVPEVPVRPGNSSSQVSSGSQSQPDLTYEGAKLPDVAKSGRKDGYYTFLLCGQDVVSGATDTMILITYDTKGKAISAISLLRDTMINTSARSKRLNTAFARNLGDRGLPDKERVENGMSALRQEVSRLTGVYPDFYVLVEWEAIGRLVDAIDGVYFDVPFDMDYDDPTPGQDLHIHQKKGYRLLDGQDAMEVIRFRKSNDESLVLYDSGRTQIQRDFMTAVLKKCLTPEILLKLPSLVQIFIDNVDTDLTVGNILAFAQLAVGMNVENNVKFVSMPFYNVRYGGASMVCAIQDELLELLNDGVNPYVDEIKASDLQLMYQRSGGGFGVTNGKLADPAVARVYVAPKPAEPDEPDEPDSSGEPAGDPDVPSGEEMPEEPDPEGPGDVSQPGEPSEPENPATIDPADIFPDPTPGSQSGGEELPQQQDETQAVA